MPSRNGKSYSAQQNLDGLPILDKKRIPPAGCSKGPFGTAAADGALEDSLF